ncbi:MAG: hypothetical protein HFG14_00530 [Lachnospiraceae bacterium]|jgi:hypothetical protein|nr:hypothetical protein [Lachnospiraceae bacterium]NBJ80762.1 hypothetical protein [bacterium 1XD42-76]NBK03971.1 hypothetical protein [bacterium 1XD42-94]
MPKKTNKTSHVMDLLTNGSSSEANEPSTAAAPQNGASSHAAAPKKVTVVDEGSINDRVSQEILNKLSEELKEENQAADVPAAGGQTDQAANISADGQAAQTADTSADIQAAQTADVSTDGQAVPATVQNTDTTAQEPLADVADALDSNIQEQSSASQDAPNANTPVQTESSQMDEVPVKATPQSIIPQSQISSRLLNNEYHFVNVMEQLILRQNMDSYLEQYNVCKCTRCMADVCALTLTGLPSKYVVTSKDSLSPLLSYYESKYKIYMLTEIIKACNKVRENPRHK